MCDWQDHQGCLNTWAPLGTTQVHVGPMIILQYIILANCPGFAGLVVIFTKLSQDGRVPESGLRGQQQAVTGLKLQLE